MSFSTIRDQEVALRLLRNMLQRSRVPNGLLLWGPEGVGKQMAALELTKALNCNQKNADACDTCLSCRRVVDGNHPDVMKTAPRKKSRVIDVESIEMVNEMASLRPHEGAWRAFIILEADRMNTAAQNHFLKTLEEPPGRSVFILVTDYPRRLLPTIRSRCQHVRFGPLKPATVQEILIRERNLSSARAEAIAAVAQGQAARALELADSETRDVVLNITKRLAEGMDPLELAGDFAKYLAARKSAIETKVKSEMAGPSRKEVSTEDYEDFKQAQAASVEALVRRDIIEHLYVFETWYRDQLIYGISQNPRYVLNKDQTERLASAVGDCGAKINAIEKARVYLERFLNEERIFRDLFFKLAS